MGFLLAALSNRSKSSAELIRMINATIVTTNDCDVASDDKRAGDNS